MKQPFRLMMLMVLSACVISSEAARANEVYECEARLPLGTVSLEVRPAKDGSQELGVEFAPQRGDEAFTGTLPIERIDDQYLFAEGELSSGGDLIPVRIQVEFNDEKILGSMQSSDKRIELGFGNRLICQRVP